MKYLKENPNVLLSGAWDDSIFLWDVRSGKSEGSILGASISGDSIDISGNVVLSGSYRNSEQI